MVAISSPPPNDISTEHRVILIGFDSQRVKSILADDAVTKLVIFDDDNDNTRSDFERMYPIYKDRITLYEGDVKTNMNGYYELRKKEGSLAMHRVEVHNNNLLKLFKIL